MVTTTPPAPQSKKSTTNRDDFKASVRTALALRAGHRCSLPGCRMPTAGPSEEGPAKHVDVGVAAHINAAAPGGPRYKTSMTPEQRADITNAIWLCQTHSKLIDRDTVTFTEDFLHRTKDEHDIWVRSQMTESATSFQSGDFIALGPDIVFTGELVGSNPTTWTFRLDHFLIGELNDLIRFGERFDAVDPYDRYVLVNTLGDGRQLAGPPTWSKDNDRTIVTVSVIQSFPRTDAHHLPMDLALDVTGDLFLRNGDLATVRGLDALPQRIRLCLSTSRGEVLYSPAYGSRIREYYQFFFGTVWLDRLVKLEAIRMASIPYREGNGEAATPLRCVNRVLSVEVLESESTNGSFPFRFQLEIEGDGQWTHELPVYVSRDL